eukprot:7092581-Pyramimonas_sp.AAC.1
MKFLGLRRQPRVTLCAPPHEVMAAEFEKGIDLSVNEARTDWADSFERHPFRHIPGDSRPVYPCALYVDGIKYTRASLAGKQDSLVGFFGYNLATGRRHLLAVLAKKEMCKCGCRGHCTTFPVMQFLAASFAAGAQGRRLPEQWNGLPWPDGDPYKTAFDKQPVLPARFILSQVKGDWSEFCGLFGFPTWQSFHSPCLFCRCSKNTMHNYDAVTMRGHAWGEPVDYDEACRKCEIKVRVFTQADKLEIIAGGALHFSEHQKRPGYILAHPVPRFRLEAHDRLEPSLQLLDIEKFEEAPIPHGGLEVTFWRSHRDKKQRVLDTVHRRSPLFTPEVGITPQTVLMVDTLHTLYLGVFQNFVACVIWEALSQNVFDVPGTTKDETQEYGIYKINLDLRAWYSRVGIPQGQR